MNTAVPRRMKDVKKWMWMEFLVQCSFLQEGEMGWARTGQRRCFGVPFPVWSPAQGSLLVMVTKSWRSLPALKSGRAGLCCAWGCSGTRAHPRNLWRAQICSTRRSAKPELERVTREGQHSHSSPVFPVFLLAGMGPGCSRRAQAEGSHPCWDLSRVPPAQGAGAAPSPTWSIFQAYLKQEKMPMATSSAAIDVE